MNADYQQWQIKQTGRTLRECSVDWIPEHWVLVLRRNRIYTDNTGYSAWSDWQEYASVDGSYVRVNINQTGAERPLD